MSYKDQYDRASKEKTLEEITPTFIKFEKEGEKVVGKFIDTVEIVSQQSSGKYLQYIFDTDEGRVKFHMGSNADKEVGALMKKGAVYFVQYKGKEDIGHNQQVNKWSVMLVDDSDAEVIPADPKEF